MDKDIFWSKEWKSFKRNLPHKESPYSKRNWGNSLHSLCSYSGKIKPAIAHHLLNIFVPSGGRVLDPFSGVGTIPFEAVLQGKIAYGFDLNPCAYVVTNAKLNIGSNSGVYDIINNLKTHISKNEPTKATLREADQFGYNGKISDYFHPKTLKEVLLARDFFLDSEVANKDISLVLSCMLHILHGNRNYALSRRSHPITPYAPSGEFEYKPLIPRLKTKVEKSINTEIPEIIGDGNAYLLDSTEKWPLQIDDLDAVITSPPFFDSTRFYLANWMRLWFMGWSKDNFEKAPNNFVDERQKIDFSVYAPILRQARERLKEDGVVVFHLGKSDKCDMAKNLSKVSKPWFANYEIFDEDVSDIEKHGIRDKGRVTSHQYLVLY